MREKLTLFALATLLTGCGYHVSGHADLLPKTVKTIAIPAFGNNTTRYRLTERMPQAITREFLTRSRYRVTGEEKNADAVLRGTVLNILSFPTTFDTASGRAAGVQMNVIVKVQLIERATGKELYANPSLEIRDRYEISTNQVAYFDESDAALDRLSRQVASAVVAAILEAF
ncbi:MAG: LptE family protein [Candidatus Solibacter usitatus]|nr:LptE family protein [Candidatus Solibacter usitatus]